MIFTTKKPLSEWGKVLHDEDLAAAILDRVLERARFIQLDGPSGRTRNLNLEEVWPAAAERLRISGTHSLLLFSVCDPANGFVYAQFSTLICDPKLWEESYSFCR